MTDPKTPLHAQFPYRPIPVSQIERNGMVIGPDGSQIPIPMAMQGLLSRWSRDAVLALIEANKTYAPPAAVKYGALGLPRVSDIADYLRQKSGTLPPPLPVPPPQVDDVAAAPLTAPLSASSPALTLQLLKGLGL